MRVLLEFRLRVGDEHVVGEMKLDLEVLPPLGSLLYMHGVRFTVSDVVTSIGLEKQEGSGPRFLSRDIKIECSASFEDDDAFMDALCKLAQGLVRFDEEIIDAVESEMEETLRPRHLYVREAG